MRLDWLKGDFAMRAMLLIGLSLFFCTPSARADELPNIIVFLIDDMGVMDTSVPFMIDLSDTTGTPRKYPLNEFYDTPGMQRLANQGIRFNQFQAMSVCSPTRISLLTGQHPARHRTTNWIHPSQNNRQEFGPRDWNWQGLNRASVTLPRLMQGSGYRTIHIGKAHFGPQNAEGSDPRNLGFEISIAGNQIGHPGSYYGNQSYGQGTSHAVPDLEAYHQTDTFLTEALTEQARLQIDAAVQSQQPFFLHMSHYAVHSPFQSDPRFAEKFTNSQRSKPAQAFASLISGIDHSLEAILDHLESRGIGENTLIFFLGDNGTDAPLGHEHAIACAEPLRGKKGSHYEGAVRVPLIASWASPNPRNPLQQKLPIPTNSIQSQMASVLDLFPTLLELLDIPTPPDHPVDGESMLNLLRGETDNDRSNEFMVHFPHDHRSRYFTTLRQGDWKLVFHYFPGKASAGEPLELFDLATDPSESFNRASELPEKSGQLLRRMQTLLEEYQAVYPEDGAGIPLKPSADDPSGDHPQKKQKSGD
jgi:arylsulfatase A-like enzyme